MGARAPDNAEQNTVDTNAETLVSSPSGERTLSATSGSTQAATTAVVNTILPSEPIAVDASPRPLAEAELGERHSESSSEKPLALGDQLSAVSPEC